MKLAQEIRDGTRPVTAQEPLIDQDLGQPALSILGELIDTCGSETEPAILEGYAYGLCQAGLIDEFVLKAITSHIATNDENDSSKQGARTFRANKIATTLKNICDGNEV